MQIYNTEVLDIIERALDDRINKIRILLIQSTPLEHEDGTVDKWRNELKSAIQVNQQIHEDNKRLKYQQLRDSSKTNS